LTIEPGTVAEIFTAGNLILDKNRPHFQARVCY